MMLMPSDRTSPLFLVQRKQDLWDLVAGLLDLCMGFEIVAEVPRLLVKIRVIPQHERVVIACAWLPTLQCEEGREGQGEPRTR